MGLEIEKAEGVHLIDTNGKRYIDLISGISVSNIGHGHPKVVEAIKAQVDRYMHLMVYGEYVQSPQVKLAHKLTQCLGHDLDSVYFVNSGSEATEGALKLAKRYSGKSEIISMKNAYHGSTHGALSIIGDESFKRNFRPLLPGTFSIAFNDFDNLKLVTSKTAAVIVEPVQGEAGYIPPKDGYLEALRKKCDDTGSLLIFDEIQTGFGRTGSLFAFQQYNVVPDIITLAKGMGGGMPIGAFIASKKVMDSLKENPILGHITTFGGHPVSCAASLACLNAILDENLIAGVQEKSDLFKELLVHPQIKEVRGKGLMLACQLDTFETVQEVIDYCLNKGLITDWFLFCDNAIRISPPLTISKSEIEEACGILMGALDQL